MKLTPYQITLFLCFSLFAVLVPAQENPNPSPAVDAYILNEMEMERFAGASVVIVKDGQIVFLESYGMADMEQNLPVEPNTVFLLASVSKLFTGTAAMQLA